MQASSTQTVSLSAVFVPSSSLLLTSWELPFGPQLADCIHPSLISAEKGASQAGMGHCCRGNTLPGLFFPHLCPCSCSFFVPQSHPTQDCCWEGEGSAAKSRLLSGGMTQSFAGLILNQGVGGRQEPRDPGSGLAAGQLCPSSCRSESARLPWSPPSCHPCPRNASPVRDRPSGHNYPGPFHLLSG